MSRAAHVLAEELCQLETLVGTPHVCWVHGFTVRDPKDLGRTPEGRILRRLYSMSLRVRGRRPFDISQLSGHAGQSMGDWLESGISAFERWLDLPEHAVDEAEDASAEGSVHGESHSRVPSLDAMQPTPTPAAPAPQPRPFLGRSVHAPAAPAPQVWRSSHGGSR